MSTPTKGPWFRARLLASALDMYELLRQCHDYLDCIPETAAGGDDEARALAATVLSLIDKIDGDSDDTR